MQNGALSIYFCLVSSTSTSSNTTVESVPQPEKSLPTVSSVAGNVGTFLSSIRASFRQDNVNVTTKQHPKKASLQKDLFNLIINLPAIPLT